MNIIKESDKFIIGLDISTKTIGCALFEDLGTEGKLNLLTAVTPKVKPVPESKMEELFKKAQIFQTEFINKYIGMNITKVIIEEPLLRSNNVNTVATLLRFNGMISKAVYETLGVVPEFISSYDSRAYAFPDLLAVRKADKKGIPYSDKVLKSKNPVLFGAYPIDVDKKEVIWKKVSNLEPKVSWLYDKNGILKKENFDMSDSYACVRGYMRKNEIWL
jgi:hypothetical protein